MNQYQVAAGIVVFNHIAADSPREAIAHLKQKIADRGLHYDQEDEKIGMSLVRAYWNDTLNYLVFSPEHQLLAGELNYVPDPKLLALYSAQRILGFQSPVSRELADAMRSVLSDKHYEQTRSVTSGTVPNH